MAKKTRIIETVIAAKDLASRIVGGAMAKMKKSFNAIKKVALLTIGAIAGVGTALIAMATTTASAGDELQKMALRTGMSAQALSELKFAAEISGTTIETFEKGVKTLAKRISDANFGLETYQRIFRNLGVEYRTASGELREVDVVFMDAIEAINKLGSETEKAAMAQELFGKAGTQLLPMMKSGKTGIQELREEAQKLGITFTDLEADQAAAFTDELLRAKDAVKGLWRGMGKDLIPTFTQLLTKITTFITESPGFAKAVDTITAAFTRLGRIVGIDTRTELEKVRVELRDLERAEAAGVISLDKSTWAGQRYLALREQETQLLPVVFGKVKEDTEARDENTVAIDRQTEAEKRLVLQKELALVKERERILAAKTPGVVGTVSEFGAEALQMEEQFQALVAHHDRRIAFLTAIGAHEVDIRAAVNQAQIELDEQMRQKRIAIATSVTGALASVAESLYVMMGSKGKAMLKVVKFFGIQEAVVKGYVAAVDAWQKGMSVGGPPVAAVFTAASLAKTGALIAKIGGSQGGDVGTSPMATPSIGRTPSAIAPAQEIQPAAQVNITINAPYGKVPPETIDEIIEGVNLAFKRKVYINFAGETI